MPEITLRQGPRDAILKELMEVWRRSVREVCVNEQDPQAQGFYEHLGFRVYQRTDRDEQGGPYPLLYLRLAGERPPCAE